MRKDIKSLSFPFMLLMALLSSCNQKVPAEETCLEIDFSSAEETAVPELFSSVNIIPLESTADSYMYDTNELKTSAHYFVISDVRNNLYVYDSNGDFISSSASKVGEGPGEYSIITAYSFNPKTEQIEICTPNKLLFYDIHFNLQSEVSISGILSAEDEESVFIRKMYNLGENRLAVSVSGREKRQEALLIVDIQEGKVLKEISYADDVIAPITMQDKCFSDLQENKLHYYTPCFTPYIYLYDRAEMSLTPYLRLNFGPDALQMEDVLSMQDNENKLSEYLLTCDKIIPVKTWNDKNHIVSVARQGNRMKDMKTFVYDCQAQKACAISCYSDDGLRFPVFRDADGPYLYSIVRNAQLPEILSAADGTQVINENPDRVQDEDGVSIIEYRFK